jgi:Ca2+-binding RTX toxin-like protein
MADDFKSNVLTTGLLGFNIYKTGTIETPYDTDWFKISLTAGERIRFDLEGSYTHKGSLSDPYIRGIYDSAGGLLSYSSNDDAGGYLNSIVYLDVPSTATYYVSAGAYWVDKGSYSIKATSLGHLPTGQVTINDSSPETNQTLTVSNTLADRDGMGTISYTWLINGYRVVGTGDSYTVGTTDAGKSLSVTASYTDDLGHAESIDSIATSAVTFASLTINGTPSDDVLNGDKGNDVLNGAEGNDRLHGAQGNDTLNGGDGNDALFGNAGNDVENGNGGDDFLGGIMGDNTLNGGAGNDKLLSGAGYNVLTGGVGSDIFRFISGSHSTISDFVAADDTVQLDNAFFTQFTTRGVLNASMLKIGVAAVDANDYLIYNETTGALFYDDNANGAGHTVQIALLGVTTHPTLTNADFVVI